MPINMWEGMVTSEAKREVREFLVKLNVRKYVLNTSNGLNRIGRLSNEAEKLP
jgi:hypothetical protein